MLRATPWVVLFLPLWTMNAHALSPTCFNFDTGKVSALTPPSLLKGKTFKSASGIRDEEVAWGSTVTTVKPSISKIYDWLLDHKNWKDMDKTKMVVKELPPKTFLQLHRVEVDVNVWAFIWINWVEEWGYKLLKGTKKAPEQILAVYQKIDGTDRIKRLCGSVLLTKTNKGTEVAFYEEARADHYEAPAILDMHSIFIKRLNALK